MEEMPHVQAEALLMEMEIYRDHLHAVLTNVD